MPWILWDLPVEVRPREPAARPGSLREVPRVTGSTEFPDERVSAAHAAGSDSDPDRPRPRFQFRLLNLGEVRAGTRENSEHFCLT